MILVIDDERTIRQPFSIKHREKFLLPNFTDKQLNILKKDLRNAEITRSFDQTIHYLTNNPLPDLISFDHHLGHKQKTGLDVLKYIVNNNLGFFEAYFHSADPIGRKNMKSLYDSYIKHIK